MGNSGLVLWYPSTLVAECSCQVQCWRVFPNHKHKVLYKCIYSVFSQHFMATPMVGPQTSLSLFILKRLYARAYLYQAKCIHNIARSLLRNVAINCKFSESESNGSLVWDSRDVGDDFPWIFLYILQRFVRIQLENTNKNANHDPICDSNVSTTLTLFVIHDTCGMCEINLDQDFQVNCSHQAYTSKLDLNNISCEPCT